MYKPAADRDEKRLMKKWYSNKCFWLVTVLIVAVGALSSGRIMEAKNHGNKPPREIQPVKVQVSMVTRGPIQEWVSGEGTARAVHREFLSFENAGKVVFIGKEADGFALREGSAVRGPGEGEGLGQLIARVDSRDYLEALKVYESEKLQAIQGVEAAVASVAQAKEELALRTKNYRRAEKLFRKGAYAQSRFDSEKSAFVNARASLQGAEAHLKEARSRVAAATAQVQKTKLAIEKRSIFAPFDGVVTRMNIRVGDYASLSPLNTNNEEALFKTAAVVVVDPSSFEITLDLPVYYGTMVSEGQHAMIRFNGMYMTEITSSRFVEAFVYSVAPAVTPGKRSIRVTLRTVDSESNLIDGSFVVGRIAVQEKSDAILVPSHSLLYQNSKPYVFVVDAETGIASRRDVKVGIQGAITSEIIDGLSVGEFVAVKGKHCLANGAPIEIAYGNKEQ